MQVLFRAVLCLALMAAAWLGEALGNGVRIMSVCTTTFGGVRLTDEDAKKFNDQLAHGKPKKAAVRALSRGKRLADQYVKSGFVGLK